jgi:hypothetical protein
MGDRAQPEEVGRRGWKGICKELDRCPYITRVETRKVFAKVI